MKDLVRIRRIRTLKERMKASTKSTLSEAERELRRCEADLARIDEQLQGLNQHMVQVGTVSARDAVGRARLLARVIRLRAEAERALREQATIRDRCARDLMRAGQELAAIETLEGRLVKDQKRQEQRAERRSADEIAARRRT